MTFVALDGVFRFESYLILSICFVLQPMIVTSNPLCFSKEVEVENFWTNSSSESSVLVTWEYPAYEYNESHSTKAPNLYLNAGDHLALKYTPCRYESWPTLVRDPATNVYLARYDVEERFYSQKVMNLSGVKSYPIPPTRIRTNVTNLPFPGRPYAFRLDRVVDGLFHRFVGVLGRTNPPTPKVCAGCFRILWAHPREQKRKVRVYWPRRVGQRVSFLLSASEKGSNYTETLVDERGISDDTGYVDVVIGMRSHVFRFSEGGQYARSSSSDLIIVVPDVQNLLELVSNISMTIDSNTSAGIHTLSWLMPKNVDVVEYYTLVWYDRMKWRRDPDHSPIMDWIYIPGKRTSIKFRMVDSNEEDVRRRVGWRLIANTASSSSGLQVFDN